MHENEIAVSRSALQISAPTELDAPVAGPAQGMPLLGGVASSGSQLMAVWFDNFTVLGAQFEFDGGLANTPFTIGAAVIGSASLAFGGGVYLVAWSTGAGNSSDIVARRFDVNGAPLDAKELVICNAPQAQFHPRVAFDGTRFVIVWEDWRAGSGNLDIYATSVTVAGAVAGATGFVVEAAPLTQFFPSVDCAADQCLVTSVENGIFVERVQSGATVLDTSIFVAAAAYLPRVVVATDAGYLLAWTDTDDAGLQLVRATRVDRSAALLDGSGFTATTSHQAAAVDSAASLGGQSIVLWESNDGTNIDVRATPINLQGAVLDPLGWAVGDSPENDFNASVTTANGAYFVGYQHLVPAAGPESLGRYLTPTGQRSAPFTIGVKVNSETVGEVASDGTRFVAVWRDRPERTCPA